MKSPTYWGKRRFLGQLYKIHPSQERIMTQLTYEKLDHPEILQTIFHPRSEPLLPASDLCDNHSIPVADDVEISARFHLASPKDPHILFFHGNGEIANDYNDVGPTFTRHGLNLMAVDYRGYGASDGVPTATNLMTDCHQIFAYIKNWMQKEKRTGPLFVMGRSLGSAVAIELVFSHKDEVSGMIIESAFANTIPLLLDLGLDPQALGISSEAQGCKNIQKIEKINKPTMILHAAKDELIPLANGELLHSVCLARHKELQIVPGAGHNNIMAVAGDLYFSTIKQFTNKVMKVRPRKRRS